MAERGYRIPPHLLDDLCSRFILNVPDHIRTDFIRIFFQIELAHWFYIDFFVPEDPSLKPVGIKEFANQVSETDDVDTLHRDWRKYKLAVPTCGVILLDESRKFVLLVQGFSKSWGFPKGKINEDEPFVKAAVRELREETGHDISDVINESHYVEHTVGDQKCRLYIVPDVSLDTHFLPQTRNEIKALQWFPLDVLPVHKKDASSAEKLGCGPNNFFMVIPFLKPLRRWITQNNPQSSPQKVEAQRAYTMQTVTHFEELLGMASTPHRSAEKSRRAVKKTGQHYSRHNTASPQYTILKKESKEETLKKLQNIKQMLDSNSEATDQPLAIPAVEQNLIKPCKEWKNFKLDVEAIMKASSQFRLQ